MPPRCRTFLPAVVLCVLTGAVMAETADSPGEAALAAGLEAYDVGDAVTAAREFERAAELGNAEAGFRLANMYETGDGVGASMVRALDWYRIAAEQGSEKAQFNLGHLYATGRNVERNLHNATRYYRMAAEQDNPHAQLALALILYRGEGRAPRDLVEAYRWVTLAVHNYEPTHFRDNANDVRREVIDAMTQEQRAEGRRRVDAHYARQQ